MSKIAIISQPDQGVLIDVSGCTTLKEALDHLSSTLQVSNQFWHGMNVSINLGALAVTKDELAKILAIARSVGINPAGVYSTSDETRDSLRASKVPLGAGKPMTLPAVSMDPTKVTSAEFEDDRQKAGPLATITMRVVDAMRKGSSKEAPAAPVSDELENMSPEEVDAGDWSNGKQESTGSNFPHVKAKRKVSLDGRKVHPGEQPPKAGKPAKDEDGDITLKLEPEVDGNGDVTLKLEKPHEPIDGTLEHERQGAQHAPAVGKMPIELSPQVEPADKLPSASKAPSRSDQEITGPQVEVKVMTIQAVNVLMNSMDLMEAQPAQKALAQAATMQAEFVTPVDAERSVDNPQDRQSVLQDDDVENAEDFDLDEEFETDSLDFGLAQRGGPTTLYIHQTLRSGQTVSHKGHLVIIGDINPGAEVMADGDITVWGCLRGVAHAGIGGNVNAEIRALKLQPIQIRIAHAIARAPDRPRMSYATTNGPETARMVDGKIRVVRSRLE